MRKWLLGVLVLFCATDFCLAAPGCEAVAKAQKLTGADRNAFLAGCRRLPASLPLSCEEQATQKKLSGQAKRNFVQNCERPAEGAKK